MKKEINVEEIQEVMETQEEVMETKSESIITKGMKCVKRNGKKIGKGIGLIVGGVVLYTLGKHAAAGKSVNYDEDYIAEDADFEPEDIEVE